MPPRLNILEKRWSTFDSPILPFLAPSVFEPWPSYTRHNFSRRRELKKIAGYAKRAPENSPKHSHFAQPKSIRRLEIEDEKLQEEYKKTWSPPSGKESQPTANIITPPKKSRPQLVHYKASTSHITLGFKPLSFGPSKARARESWMEARKQRQALSRRIIQSRIHRELVRLGIPRSRPRYISLPIRYRYRFAWTVGEWNRRFAALHFPHEKFTKARPVPGQVLYHGRRNTVEIPRDFEKALIEHVSTTSFRQLWEDLDVRTRTTLWPEIMMTALDVYPDAALSFLEATYQHPYPPAFAVTNCLDHIISSRYSRPLPDDLKENERFVRRIRVLLYLGAQKRVRLAQQSIYLMLCLSSVSTSTQLYVTLKQLKHPLHENTLLQFASQLGKKSSIGVRRALKVMEQMRDQGTSMNNVKALSVFSTLLDRDDRNSNARELDSIILQFMMDNGLSPNIITYNILLRNSLRDGEHETGWKIYQMMRENGIEPDAFTYSTLLNDSKRRMDAERMREIVSIVREKGIRDAYTVTDVLHAIFLLQRGQEERALGYQERDRESKPAFARMFGVYAEFFHTEPLQLLIPTITSENHLQNLEQLCDPPACTLVVMVTAYLAHLQTSTGMKRFYDNFLALLAVRNETALDLAKTSRFWAVIIMNFSRFEDNLAHCPEVVGHMLQHMPRVVIEGDIDNTEPDPTQPEFAAKDDGDSDSLTSVSDENVSTSTKNTQLLETVTSRENVVAPDVYIWSILLKIFMDHRQPRAAEKVLEMMKEHGVKPNIVTWNTLIVGYSKMQATLDTVDAVRRMEDAGFRPDDFTLTALARLNDKRTMMAAMQRYEQLKARKVALQQEDSNENPEQDEVLESDELIREWDQVGGSLDWYKAEQGVNEDAVDGRRECA
jgi:pentatricopeptide repeat protein